MPELPEVERVRCDLERAILDKRLDGVEFRRAALRWPMPRQRIRRQIGATLTAVERRGKYLLLGLSAERRAGRTLLVHLGMSGRVLVARAAKPPDWDKHEHWRMRFGASLLRYVDPRRFGALLLAERDKLDVHPLLARLGPDPFAAEFDADYLWRTTRARKVTLKTFLLDGRRIAGIGNIYACEACFEARLLPQLRVDRLSRAGCARLCDAVRAVLGRALAAGGTTLRDYVDASGSPGTFQFELRVYGRAGEPCKTCRSPIRMQRNSGRSTFYCPRCQKRTAARA